MVHMKMIIPAGVGFVMGSLVMLSLNRIIAIDTPAQLAIQNNLPHPTDNPDIPLSTPPVATPSATTTLAPTRIPNPTPTPSVTLTPTPTPIPVTADHLDGWFTAYSNLYSVDRQLLSHIAVCESQLNPNAVNGVYAGLYQFSGATWKSTRNAMNLDPNPQLRYNAEESIHTAAFKLSTSGPASWPNCKQV